MTLKLMFLRLTQTDTFQRAEGLIFLSEYSRGIVLRIIKKVPGVTRIIPHGIEQRFTRQPRKQLAINQYSITQPFRLLYVSIVDVYKHQWNVAEAVARIRKSGFPVVLDLVGPAYQPAMKRLQQTLRRIDPNGEFIRYRGVVPYETIDSMYSGADMAVFASSCETFGQILTESMSAGLPIACSNRSSLPEVLGDTGVYFDPESVDSIVNALSDLINDPELRAVKAQAAFERSQGYSWERCAHETFEFIVQVAGQKLNLTKNYV